jgi:hypothetical protein
MELIDAYRTQDMAALSGGGAGSEGLTGITLKGLDQPLTNTPSGTDSENSLRRTSTADGFGFEEYQFTEGAVRVFNRNLRSRSAIEFHAFAPLEALTCV